MKLKTASAMLLTVFFVAGCANSQYGTKQTAGGMLGAAGGGLLGAQFGSGSSQLAATAAGVFIGALLGSEIGRSMDEVDRLKANQAINQAHSAPLGNTITWNNPESGNSGTVTPMRDGTGAAGEYCREFQQTVIIGGKAEEGYGTACRQSDGTWRIIPEPI